MPQLKSGRHVGLAIDSLLDRLRYGDNDSSYGRIIAQRMSVTGPQAFIRLIDVGEYRDGEGSPPDAPCYPAGYTVGEVLDGHPDWTPSEIEELRQLVETDPRCQVWLKEQIRIIKRVIRESRFWNEVLEEGPTQ